jgi:hypothetical protein
MPPEDYYKIKVQDTLGNVIALDVWHDIKDWDAPEDSDESDWWNVRKNRSSPNRGYYCLHSDSLVALAKGLLPLLLETVQ